MRNIFGGIMYAIMGIVTFIATKNPISFVVVALGLAMSIYGIIGVIITAKAIRAAEEAALAEAEALKAKKAKALKAKKAKAKKALESDNAKAKVKVKKPRAKKAESEPATERTVRRQRKPKAATSVQDVTEAPGAIA